MDCRIFNKIVIDYFAGELSAETKKDVEKHIKECASCRKVFTEIQDVIEKSRNIEVPSFSESFWEKKKEFVFAPRPKTVKYFLKPFLAGTVVSLILFFSIFLLKKQETKNNVLNLNYSQYAVADLPFSEDDIIEMTEYMQEEDARIILNIILKQ
jgi:hypothetical protein